MRQPGSLVKSVEVESALPVVHMHTVDPAIHCEDGDILGSHFAAAPCMRASLLTGSGAKLKRWQPQHSIIGKLVSLLCTAMPLLNACVCQNKQIPLSDPAK